MALKRKPLHAKQRKEETIRLKQLKCTTTIYFLDLLSDNRKEQGLTDGEINVFACTSGHARV